MADVTVHNTCVNLQPGGTCCLRETPCPYASHEIGACEEARHAAQVRVAPDEFVVLMLPKERGGKPAPGKFPLRRCRVTAVEEASGVHTTSLLMTRGDAALLDACELPNGSVLLTTRDGNASVMWREGKFIPA